MAQEKDRGSELLTQIGEQDGVREKLRRMARQNKLAAFSAVLIALVLLLAVFAPLVAPYGEAEQDVLARLQMTVTEAAAAMAEGVAFLILAVFFLLILSIVLSLILHSLHLLTRFPPLGWLNRLAGAALGFCAVFALDKLLARTRGFGMEAVEICDTNAENKEEEENGQNV